jgi:uncharacterized SAM-binding protein YcdF (DUF218 family)
LFVLALAFALLLSALSAYEVSIYRAIRRQAKTDEARPAGAIVVFGAAEYNGHPSPVLKARLDQAFALEERGLAPIVITTGGHGADPVYTEAAVSRDYLVQLGVPENSVFTDEESETTWESVRAAAHILMQRHASTCVAVSDGFHLCRVRLMFQSLGITAYTSPAKDSPIEADSFSRFLHSLREMLGVTLWNLGFHV